MALKRSRHDDFGAVDEELRNLDDSKEQAFVYMAGRAPTSNDRTARIWFYRNGSTMSMYVFDSTAGAWRGPTNFT